MLAQEGAVAQYHSGMDNLIVSAREGSSMPATCYPDVADNIKQPGSDARVVGLDVTLDEDTILATEMLKPLAHSTVKHRSPNRVINRKVGVIKALIEGSAQ
jgi:hypothetical protein